MKNAARSLVAKTLWRQVAKLRQKNSLVVVAVAGSIGKTSTKLAIANVLKPKYRVQFQDGNYNDLVSVPLIFFGENLPSIYNPMAWAKIFWSNRRQINKNYPYDVVVVELGTDGPGQLKEFKPYIKATIGILTSIAPEHMEYFKTLDNVASEELKIEDLSEKLFVNKDFVDEAYRKKLRQPYIGYAIKSTADIKLADLKLEGYNSSFTVEDRGSRFLKAEHETVAEPQLYAVLAAIAVAKELGIGPEEIEKGLHNIKPVSGRMQRLEGINGSTIIDDTYNASPEATKAALHTLYRLKASHKIAILGNMNELGQYSQAAHEEIGGLCDPNKLDLVLTIGPDSNKYLAAAAEAKGCRVESFNDPYSAADFLKPLIQKESLILVKGSQNRVFAEETVKLLLADPSDSSKLVRQSEHWLAVKRKAFGR
jgi:UDP-N-acetylmuramoyl-tripeptide--D-alanyl-D-alanine ligase